ncbi:hypothetical protein COW99_01020 [Candidatus Roizmanbacteria bacterium CG22_combo_CG10-13_8_21_14_all_38_20]|uniref:Uncharacterized protein n=1 Tax=Candidatus Roizmanbacteria bacterium CG22_combo_CG10-13_8_21_14_all_38_20 TaxID=1974862 RepID=A0A2H0BWA4_9BACT|nr:MAG: hypothetical protein COW99_01020 [Candidatus Roizmanbacteria bacterium CG22_combo_CG10-13_8_21_14_all_38_20]PJC31901.1 MAG: hypothetical protein CO050_01675 [Candidatus Roizmanbacteria bacterium CG_4_9_14_0_2_um_filter_38_17]
MTRRQQITQKKINPLYFGLVLSGTGFLYILFRVTPSSQLVISIELILLFLVLYFILSIINHNKQISLVLSLIVSIFLTIKFLLNH